MCPKLISLKEPLKDIRQLKCKVWLFLFYDTATHDCWKWKLNIIFPPLFFLPKDCDQKDACLSHIFYFRLVYYLLLCLWLDDWKKWWNSNYFPHIGLLSLRSMVLMADSLFQWHFPQCHDVSLRLCYIFIIALISESVLSPCDKHCP